MGRQNENDFDWQKANRTIQLKGRTRKWIAERCETTTGYLGQILCGDKSPSGKLRKLMELALEEPEGAFRRGATRTKASA